MPKSHSVRNLALIVATSFLANGCSTMGKVLQLGTSEILPAYTGVGIGRKLSEEPTYQQLREVWKDAEVRSTVEIIDDNGNQHNKHQY